MPNDNNCGNIKEFLEGIIGKTFTSIASNGLNKNFIDKRNNYLKK